MPLKSYLNISRNGLRNYLCIFVNQHSVHFTNDGSNNQKMCNIQCRKLRRYEEENGFKL